MEPSSSIGIVIGCNQGLKWNEWILIVVSRGNDREWEPLAVKVECCVIIAEEQTLEYSWIYRNCEPKVRRLLNERFTNYLRSWVLSALSGRVMVKRKKWMQWNHYRMSVLRRANLSDREWVSRTIVWGDKCCWRTLLNDNQSTKERERDQGIGEKSGSPLKDPVEGKESKGRELVCAKCNYWL